LDKQASAIRQDRWQTSSLSGSPPQTALLELSARLLNIGPNASPQRARIDLQCANYGKAADLTDRDLCGATATATALSTRVTSWPLDDCGGRHSGWRGLSIVMIVISALVVIAVAGALLVSSKISTVLIFSGAHYFVGHLGFALIGAMATAGGERTDVEKLQALLRRIQELEREKDRLKERMWKTRGAPVRLIAILMLAVGAIALVSSVAYSVTVSAFIGLGLTFWGALLLLIRPSGYLRTELMDSSMLSPIMMTDRLLGELGYGGNGVYMRDDKLEAFVFVPAENGAEIPTSSQLENNVFIASPRGVILPPPGRSLAYFLEEELGGKLTIRELARLQGRLTRVLIENLEIAKDFEMHLEAGYVRLRFIGSIYANLCRELMDNTRICSTIGCPLCSAMACILTASTQRPIAFEGESLSENGRVMEANYRFL